MKLSGTEKGIIGAIVVCTIFVVFGTLKTCKMIDDAGGIKRVMIDAGKDVKEIKQAINEGD